MPGGKTLSEIGASLSFFRTISRAISRGASLNALLGELGEGTEDEGRMQSLIQAGNQTSSRRSQSAE